MSPDVRKPIDKEFPERCEFRHVHLSRIIRGYGLQADHCPKIIYDFSFIEFHTIPILLNSLRSLCIIFPRIVFSSVFSPGILVFFP